MIELIKFGAEWCGPCKKIKPIIEQFEKENLCKVTTIDVDEQPEMAEKYSIQSIPAFVWLKNGSIVARKEFGLKSLEGLKESFQKLLELEAATESWTQKT